jgi:hypothetical protein
MFPTLFHTFFAIKKRQFNLLFILLIIPNMKYEFITLWKLNADQDKVWALLADASSWPDWWPGMNKVDVISTTENRQTASMRVGYGFYFLNISVVFDRLSKHSIALTCDGDLQGGGKTSMSQEDGLTVVEIAWNVSTTKVWMNSLGSLGRPFFSFMHNLVMKQGGVRLAKQVGGSLISNTSILK